MFSSFSTHKIEAIRDKSDKIRMVGVGNNVVFPNLPLGETFMGNLDFTRYKTNPFIINQRDLVQVNHFLCCVSFDSHLFINYSVKAKHVDVFVWLTQCNRRLRKRKWFIKS